jgi:hypothetical protein
MNHTDRLFIQYNLCRESVPPWLMNFVIISTCMCYSLLIFKSSSLLVMYRQCCTLVRPMISISFDHPKLPADLFPDSRSTRYLYYR